jgi:hypothetical protein
MQARHILPIAFHLGQWALCVVKVSGRGPRTLQTGRMLDLHLMPSALVSFVLNGISSRSEIEGSIKGVYERPMALSLPPADS